MPKKKYTYSKLKALFEKFGGVGLIWAYARLGVLYAAFLSCVKGVIRRKSADEIYYSYEPKIISALKKKYRPVMQERLLLYEQDTESRVRSNVVWFCWLQGIESAPPIVKVCYQSLCENLDGKEIRVIDDKNRKKYVQLPDYIEKRHEKRQIPHAMFSDLLRLELLIKYGGTWIDSTVFCSTTDYPKEYLDSDLFFFQYARPDDRRYASISNWFISSCSNNPMLMTLRDMLYAYWKDFNCVVEYFIFHRFFDMIAEVRPEIVAAMPYGYSPNSLALGHNWGKPFKQTTWDKLVSEVSFHKLAHQVEESVKGNSSNYYNHIISGDV